MGKLDKYCIHGGNFYIDPAVDIVYTGRKELQEDLCVKVEKPFDLSVIPRMIIHGPWGTGKTQLIE